MSARKIIADCVTGVSTRDRFEIGVRAIEALAAAGYRILGPGEMDPETIEKCAEVVSAFAESEMNNALAGVAESTGVNSTGWRKDAMHSHAQEVAKTIATSLRNLGSNGNG